MSRLLLGLGNVLAGDDGIGVRVAERLRDHPRLPPDIEVRLPGPDLLLAQNLMRGREEVILVDAVLGPEAPGTVVVLDPDDPRLLDQGASVHQLSPTAALRLLRAADPALTSMPARLLGIVIEGADVDAALSPALAGELDAITRAVLGALPATAPAAPVDPSLPGSPGPDPR